ncbi:hypothetical protein BOTBODRAFT_143968 [Botryobasidium botryosum FD-172 SS1]|uniref:Uncharacterized protein n=1 Tax=Botryobasidium botryosum (strain FD-172 SS1) TaxID=930990 RepID=A0A067N1E6_BOTB1|nr:hypothetical protein BOTBODRAFT_143968 [Botryobasidium botryosum FD-172 SS1]
MVTTRAGVGVECGCLSQSPMTLDIGADSSGSEDATRFLPSRLAPIHRLRIPDDIFSMIFELAVPADWKDKWLAPLTIAAVSRSWRRIALATPRLWTRINSRTLSAFLPHAKLAPLEIGYECFLRRESLRDFLSRVTPCSDQWRRLELIVKAAETPLLSHLANIPATKLECLEIGSQDEYLGMQPKLDLDLFSGFTPRLRELELDTIRIPLTSPIFHSLIRLRLSDIYVEGTDEDLSHQLLRIVNACPNLEVLYLRNLYTHISVDEGPDSSPALRTFLPFLRTFTLKHIQHPRVTRMLLESIQFPPTAQVKLYAHYEHDFDTELRHYFPSIPNLDLIKSLFIDWTCFNRIMRGWDCNDNELLTMDYGNAAALGAAREMRLVLQNYPMPNITRLAIQNNEGEPPADCLTTIFSNFSLLTDVSVVFRGRFYPADGQSLEGGPPALTLVDCEYIDDSIIIELRSLNPSATIRRVLRRSPEEHFIEDSDKHHYLFPGRPNEDGTE